MKTTVIQNATSNPIVSVSKYLTRYYRQWGITVLFILVSSVNFAQEGTSRASQKKHEFRFNPVSTIAFAAVDLEYEFILKPKTGIGLSVFFDYAGSRDAHAFGYEVSPYYRYYFWNKKGYNARGLYIEGSALLTSVQARSEVQFADGRTRRLSDGATAVGAGIQIGQKWVIKNGFTFELSLEGGRYLASDEFSFNELGAYVGVGIGIGYRFF